MSKPGKELYVLERPSDASLDAFLKKKKEPLPLKSSYQELLYREFIIGISVLRQSAVALTPSPLASVGEPDDRHGPGSGLASTRCDQVIETQPW